MFYNIGKQGGNYEVYGIKNKKLQLIDEHDIFRTRTIGYDNIHRGILGSAANIRRARSFCQFLEYRFPYFDNFIVNFAYYPEPSKEQYKKIDRVQYQCKN